MYAMKNVIHRPLNLRRLIDYKFLPEEYNDDENRMIFNTFDKNKEDVLVYIKNKKIEDGLLSLITKRLNKFQSDNFELYKDFSYDVKVLFENDGFHKFLIFDKNNKLKNFVCMYDFKICNKDNDLSYRGSGIYAMFFKEYKLDNIKESIELIGEYCLKNDIIDLLSFLDVFNTDDYYKDLKCLVGQSKTKFYMFNYGMKNIKNSKNFFVPI